MSEQEIARQVGTAVLECQDAKTRLAHLEQKLGRAYALYASLGKLAASATSSEVTASTIYGSQLPLGGRELMDTLNERDQAKEQVVAAVGKLRELGITCCE